MRPRSGLPAWCSTALFATLRRFVSALFPCTRGVTHRGPYKDGPGAINVPITVGGMPVNAGDIIVGDQDGLLAFPPSLAATVIEKALEQEQKNKEQSMRFARADGIAPSSMRSRRVD